MPTENTAQTPAYRFRSVSFLFTLIWLISFPLVLLAQKNEAPEEIPDGQWMKYRVDASLAPPQIETQIFNILRAKSFAPKQQQFFQDYYIKYALPRWTERANWKDLSKYRSKLRTQFQTTGTGVVHKFLTDLAFPYLKVMAENPRLNPFARSNAMYALGEMNVGDVVGGTTPPTPLPDALPVLLSTVEKDNPDYLKVAALVGLKRHIALKLPSADVPKVQKVLLQLLAASSNLEKKTESQEWVQRMVVELLGLQKAVGAGNEVVKTLLEAIGNTKNSDSVRDTAARALGELTYPAAGAPGLNALALGVAVVQLAADACGTELKRKPQDNLGRRVKNRLAAAADGLKGIKTFATDPASKTQFDALEKMFKTMQKELDAQDATESALEGNVREYQKQLKEWAAKNSAEK
jgi:hypothetical protein